MIILVLDIMLTLLTTLWNGSPRSRANDQVMRDAVAKNPITAHQARPSMRAVMTVAPTADCVPL